MGKPDTGGGLCNPQLLKSGRGVHGALLGLAAIAAGLMSGCARTPVVLDRFDWPSYAGEGEDHFGAPAQIDTDNISRLGLAWHLDIDEGPASLSAPIAVNGIIYFVAGHAVVRAVDGRSGKVLWTYDPEVWRVAGKRMRGSWGTRGLAFANGRIFVGTADGRLIALDARTGRLEWNVQTLEDGDGRYITGPPWVFDGKVAIGHGGADFAPVRGYVTAYDQATGKQVWRFYTVPGDPAKGFENQAMAMAAKTWTGHWWTFGGGGTVWNAMAYDPKRRVLYVGTGNGAPWNQKIRSPAGGDNLFLCAVIALDAATGRYLWHYQVNPGESWDYNAAMDLELGQLTIGGQRHDVLMTAPKNGFFYVLDRDTGKLLSAAPFVPVNWARGIDPASGRPIENPEARYPEGTARVIPSGSGAHSLEAMSFSPADGVAFIPAVENEGLYSDPPDSARWQFPAIQQINNGLGAPAAGMVPKAPKSALIAWDPAKQKARWRRDLPGARSFGGTLTTSGGLLFAGNSEGRFEAYEAKTGRVLWSFDAGTAVTAQPITWAAGGRQYVSVIAGARLYNAAGQRRVWNYRTQRWRLLTFALDGRDRLPPAETTAIPLVDDPKIAVDPAAAARGASLFAPRCAICHGSGTVADGAAPDLGQSGVPLDDAAFASVVQDGALEARGMPRFEELSAPDRMDLRAYIRSRARERLAK